MRGSRFKFQNLVNLTVMESPETKQTIVFSEWSAVNSSMLKRRDYMFKFFGGKTHQFSLFIDEGNAAAIYEPVKDYPMVHFLKLGGDE